jgi:hypothetical protein
VAINVKELKRVLEHLPDELLLSCRMSDKTYAVDPGWLRYDKDGKRLIIDLAAPLDEYRAQVRGVFDQYDKHFAGSDPEHILLEKLRDELP